MAIKERLKQSNNINKEIDSLIEVAETLRSKAERTTASIGDSTSAHDPHSRELIIAKLVDTERLINQRIDCLCDVQAEIVGTIAKIPDSTYRLILTMHYVDKVSLTDIAQALNYSYSHIKRLRDEAIKEYSKISKDEPQ